MDNDKKYLNLRGVGRGSIALTCSPYNVPLPTVQKKKKNYNEYLTFHIHF